MAYEETFQQLPRLSESELYQIPEINFGEIRPLVGLVKLEKIPTSDKVRDWMLDRWGEGEVVVPRVSKNIRGHNVVWINRVGVGHQVVCDCTTKDMDEALAADDPAYEERLFACRAAKTAINRTANAARAVLGNDEYLHCHGDTDTLKGMIRFMISYAASNPDVWLANHRSGVILVGAAAQATRRSYDEAKEIVLSMEAEGEVALGGPRGQVVSPSEATKRTQAFAT